MRADSTEPAIDVLLAGSAEARMARLTKFELESHLLKGDQLEWHDASRKKQKLRLPNAKARRLFKYLLSSQVRKPTELPPAFIADLAGALSGDADPADEISSNELQEKPTAWRLHSMVTEGLGGVNLFEREAFECQFEGDSWLAEGPNGSGKSSLLGAIIWALTSTKPRDFGEVPPDEALPVYSVADEAFQEIKVGQWPPIAAFPPDAADLLKPPFVSVKLTFADTGGNTARVSRSMSGGRSSGSRTPNFIVPQILIEAGLLMPARLATMKFGEGGNQLSTAVQRLTGLDDLIAIGVLCEGLCNKAREYLSFKKKELGSANTEFAASLAEAKFELRKIERKLPEYVTKDTDGDDGSLAALGKELTNKSTQLTKVIAGDLLEDLDLSLPATQQAVAAAIIAAKQDVAEGLSVLPLWKTLDLVMTELGDGNLQALATAITKAKRDADNVLEIFRQTQSDSRFQLKAIAAAWHGTHADGDVDNCPLCAGLLNDDLKLELRTLRSAGEAATRTFADSERAILDSLTEALPLKLRQLGVEIVGTPPAAKLRAELRSKFARNPRFSDTLTKFSSLVDTSIDNSPATEFVRPEGASVDEKLIPIHRKIEFIEGLIQLRAWFSQTRDMWVDWWNELSAARLQNAQIPDASAESDMASETWASHLARLSEALVQAEPYRLGAAALRRAYRSGKTSREIEVELAVRQNVANEIEPLKLLGSLVESEVRGTIEALSSRMESTLDRTLISDRVKFKTARFNKKEGVSVRASISEKIQIDASSIVNASWMRAVLWAFIFAIREEAVDQLGFDQFPLMVLDDPQATFDDQHRHRWSQQIASLQNGPGKVQVILASHDHNFLDLIRYSGVGGRSVLLSAAAEDTGHLTIFDGEQLERLWAKAAASKSDDDGRAYMNAARIQIEAVLQIMLRGEESGVAEVGDGFVIGKCRDKLEWLHNKAKPPWDKHSVSTLVKHLQKDIPAIKHLEMSHHASTVRLGMAEAIDVHSHLKSKLLTALIEAFTTQREHFRLHGGLTKLHASATVIPMPQGYGEEVRKIPFRILGRAAALSNGKFADGRIEMAEYEEASLKKIALAQHLAYRLLTPTLEPVARPGDILIVSNSATPTPNSFVIASTRDALYARRLELARNHADVAVLIAQANNPRKIAPPVIAQRSTFELKKVVGVLYDDGSHGSPSSENEFEEISGAAAFSRLLSDQIGLVEVVGESAEPIALNKQYIIVGAPSSTGAISSRQSGRPVIAEDIDGHRYFKRLQVIDGEIAVLESLDTSGDHPPLVMDLRGSETSGRNTIKRIWSVSGVIFEIPT